MALWGDLNAILNRLVAAGTISRFWTNLGKQSPPCPMSSSGCRVSWTTRAPKRSARPWRRTSAPSRRGRDRHGQSRGVVGPGGSFLTVDPQPKETDLGPTGRRHLARRMADTKGTGGRFVRKDSSWHCDGRRLGGPTGDGGFKAELDAIISTSPSPARGLIAP